MDHGSTQILTRPHTGPQKCILASVKQQRIADGHRRFQPSNCTFSNLSGERGTAAWEWQWGNSSGALVGIQNEMQKNQGWNHCAEWGSSRNNRRPVSPEPRCRKLERIPMDGRKEKDRVHSVSEDYHGIASRCKLWEILGPEIRCKGLVRMVCNTQFCLAMGRFVLFDALPKISEPPLSLGSPITPSVVTVCSQQGPPNPQGPHANA